MALREYATVSERDNLLIDRYADTVMFPWIGMNRWWASEDVNSTPHEGRTTEIVNSPDSEIYHKDQQLSRHLPGEESYSP